MLCELFSRKRAAGSRGGDISAEILGWHGRLAPDCQSTFLTNTRRAADPVYASAELLWYLSRSNTLEALLPYAPKYIRFAEDDGTAYGAYGHRILHNVEGYDLLEIAESLLATESRTRQCVVSMWRPQDLLEAKKGTRKDLPCTLNWQFLLRDDALHMITTMRSNDVWLGVPYDIYTFTCIQRLLAGTLDVAVGEYIHNVGSLHLYSRNEAAAHEAFATPCERKEHLWTASKIEHAWDAIDIERNMRAGQSSDVNPPLKRLTLLSDTVACIGRKWGHDYPIHSLALQKALANVDSRRG